MITLNLERICALKGIVHPYAFLAANGFSHHPAHDLSNGHNKSISFAHLEKLCRIFHCLPHDILDYKPTARGLDPTNDVLAPLTKKPLETKDLNSLIASLPPDEIINLATELQARFKKPTEGE